VRGGLLFVWHDHEGNPPQPEVRIPEIPESASDDCGSTSPPGSRAAAADAYIGGSRLRARSPRGAARFVDELIVRITRAGASRMELLRATRGAGTGGRALA